ncbi:alpha/beta hydrolase [Sphingobacterium pedocola]|uniref:Lipase n=1 Tax=Sphingobacterium pedocola TaxID=2082722 RepID=A0ABR9TCS1_9SPHI|nr:alpha/beta hydrolase [Sphingobacterium pedocola]MBE8723166.1 lipase [Sphingobacterium pedocola]
MKNLITTFCFLFLFLSAFSQEMVYQETKDITYTAHSDGYSQEKCKIDIYYPENKKDFITLIWFHGGGLTGGSKEIPDYLKNKGIAIVGVGYRFSPQVKVVDIIGDAADAVKWTFEHIAEYGGSPRKIVVGGHSAGAYLSLMLGLNKRYLSDRNISTDMILGIASFSSQAITHFTARKEKGLTEFQPTVDELAPLFWVRKDAPAILLITGDRELEMVGRYEENAYLKRMLELVGHTNVKLFELDGYDHGMTYPAYPLLLKELENWTKK